MTKAIKAPVGGWVIWIVVLSELLTFGMFFIAFAFQKANAPQLFSESQQLLNSTIASINTLLLISSSWMVVMGLEDLKNGKLKTAKRWYLTATIFGFLFLALKIIEYAAKIKLGITMSTSTFFAYYWLLTLLHFFHVVIGVIILIYFTIGIGKNKYNANNYFDVESGSIYWHLCDLLWIIIFPLIYLIH